MTEIRLATAPITPVNIIVRIRYFFGHHSRSCRAKTPYLSLKPKIYTSGISVSNPRYTVLANAKGTPSSLKFRSKIFINTM